jgi:hypothetical protein
MTAACRNLAAFRRDHAIEFPPGAAHPSIPVVRAAMPIRSVRPSPFKPFTVMIPPRMRFEEYQRGTEADTEA